MCEQIYLNWFISLSQLSINVEMLELSARRATYIRLLFGGVDRTTGKHKRYCENRFAKCKSASEWYVQYGARE